MAHVPKHLDRSLTTETSRSLGAAEAAGLTGQPKTMHLHVKVSPVLFEAAARRVGSRSPTAVVEAGLAALAMQDDLGPWLAEQWGTLAGVDSEILDELEIWRGGGA